MEEALQLSRAKDIKERMAGMERLHQLLEVSRKSLSSFEVTSLINTFIELLKDNNFRVSQTTLQALSSAAIHISEHYKLHINTFFYVVFNHLGDTKQPIRAACCLLLTLMEGLLQISMFALHCLNLMKESWHLIFLMVAIFLMDIRYFEA
ncbi:CLIP-associated protein [Glycine soja]|uniref:CLIP-associated protein n=1 Tax=Glycine soja TaxID=3848 RepID=A0A445LR33_GLYSO|nr:CLIP-associated protein [Glycine soja]